MAPFLVNVFSDIYVKLSCPYISVWIMQADQLGHSFFVFKDENNDIKVLYKRRHRGYGLLEPQ